MSQTKSRYGFFAVGCLLLTGISSFAALVVVPGSYSAAEANSSDNAPLGAVEQHFQQVFSQSLLTGLIGGEIVGIAVRVNGGESALPAQTVPSYEIRLSQSVNAPGNLSSVFANNRGPDETIVRTGPLVIQAGSFPGGSSPNAFGEIPFTTPYTYQGGDLLIEIAFEGFPGGGRNADAVYPYTAGLAQTAFGSGFNSSTADAGLYNEAIVFGFDVQFTPIPEPPQASLWAGLMLLLCGGVRVWRGRRRKGSLR